MVKVADSPKAYQFIFTLYPESQQYAIDYVKEHWSCAWALHDKDTYDAEDLKEYAKDHGGGMWETSKSPTFILWFASKINAMQAALRRNCETKPFVV